MTGYLIAFAVIFGINVLPAFGPPTWAVLVFFRLQSHLAPVGLIVLGGLAAASGRMVLALAFARLRNRVSDKTRTNLAAAGELFQGSRTRSIAGLTLFAFSPVPSAQLFEAAGLIGVRLLPLTAVFFLGRVVSYSIYVVGAGAAKKTDLGHLLSRTFTSPGAIAIEVLLLLGLVALTRVNWVRIAARHRPK